MFSLIKYWIKATNKQAQSNIKQDLKLIQAYDYMTSAISVHLYLAGGGPLSQEYSSVIIQSQVLKD